MSRFDPMVAGSVSMPDALTPAPAAPAPAAEPAGAAAPLAAPATAKPTSCQTILGKMRAISEAAQQAAFPGATSPVHVAVTDREGADYQNNSALQLCGDLKKRGAMPEGMKSPRDVAQRLAEQMLASDSEGILAKAEVAGAGFINIYLSVEWLASRVHDIVVDGCLPPPSEPRKVRGRALCPPLFHRRGAHRLPLP